MTIKIAIVPVCVVLFIAACNFKPCNHSISLDEIAYVTKYKVNNCDTLKFQNIVIEISHKNPIINLERYGLMVWFDGEGYVYKGKYKREIKVDSFPICCSYGSNMKAIGIMLIDSSAKLAYSWMNECTYDITKMHVVKIKLKSKIVVNEVDDGAFNLTSN